MKSKGMIICSRIIDMDLRSIFYFKTSFAKDEWRYQIVIHRRYVQGISDNKKECLVQIGTIISDSGIDNGYFLSCSDRWIERFDCTSLAMNSIKDKAVLPKDNHIRMTIELRS